MDNWHFLLLVLGMIIGLLFKICMELYEIHKALKDIAKREGG